MEIFSGQGPQWWGMGRGLLPHPVFFEALTSVDKMLFKHTGWSVMEKLTQGIFILIYIFLSV